MNAIPFLLKKNIFNDIFMIGDSMNLKVVDQALNIIKEKSNPLMWNDLFYNKIIEYLSDIIGNHDYFDIQTIVSIDGNYIEIRPTVRKDISNIWNCFPVYEITYYPKEDSLNFIMEKRSYINLNNDNIPDVSIYSTSETYNNEGVCEYYSKYYDMYTLDNIISINEFLDKTDVHYENGHFMSGPVNSNHPQIEKGIRFQRTNVLLETTIRDGLEETYLDLTLDDNNKNKIKLARKMNGNYYDDDNLIEEDLYRIINSVDSLYKQCSINYSDDKFLELFHNYALKCKKEK